MPQDSHIPFYHTTIRRKLQEVFKIFLRKLCGVKFPSQCNSKCCCCGCLDNLRICLLADVRPAPAVPCGAACLLCRPPALPLACFVAPIPPCPLPGGKGESQSLFRRGLRPRHPGIKPPAALTEPAKRVPCAWEPAVRRKTERTAFPWAVPAAKERGDRGRWNYPSQATAAFEMVLSPRGRANKCRWGSAPRWGQRRQGQPATNRASPPPGSCLKRSVSAAGG